MTAASTEAASLQHLFARLGEVESRVRTAVAWRRGHDADPDDRFRGLYVSDAQVDAMLDAEKAGLPPVEPDVDRRARIEAEADALEAAGVDIRLRRLTRAFELDEIDVELLLVALAPDLDQRFERLYAYLHDDVSRRRATIGLALELCTGPGLALAGTHRSRFHPRGRLQSGGLLVVEESERPFLTRSLRVLDRVTLHLLGDDTPDPLVADVLGARPLGAPSHQQLQPVVRGLGAGARVVYIRQRIGAAGGTLGVRALDEIGRGALSVDLERLGSGDDLGAVARAAIREARLRGEAIVAGPIDVLAERDPEALRAFAEAPTTVILFGARGWDPSWAASVPLLVDAPLPTAAERAEIWRSALNGSTPDTPEHVTTATHFKLTPDQVVRAAEAARLQASAADRPISAADLQAGARSQNASSLERLARRVEPRAGWDALILPDEVLAQLRGLTARVRHRDRVIDDWRMLSAAAKGRGITALFAGDSGTGKTLSAEVVAGDVGLDLYVIDLSSVVDKYIGETEKNLDRIFSEADRVNGVLLFDEADAIFGKRSEVKDARDRYANVEVAYLLQRMELFDGLAILTTNLRANVDEAFLRRLDAVVDFPMPEEADRRRLWERHLTRGAPLADDIDLEFLSAAFRLSGGNIRNVVVAAAYLAAEHGRSIEMHDLIRGTEQEYRKLGHLLVEAEFGAYFTVLDGTKR